MDDRTTVAGWQLAIDFGTCNTAAATLYDGRVEPLELEPGTGRNFPSVVLLGDGDDGIVVGTEALNSAEVTPERVVRLPKRELRAESHTLVDGERIETADLVAAIFRKVLDTARRKFAFTGQGPERVVLTHPARWPDDARDRLAVAAERAGLGTVDFMPEPVAAARWYLRLRDLAVGEYVVVYDLGGGTFDTAVLRRGPDGFEVCGVPRGREDIGGEDFDQALLEVVREHAHRRDPRAEYAVWEGRDWQSRMWRDKWAKKITQAKESLSERVRYLIREEGFYDPGIEVTRQEFEQAITRMVSRTVDELAAAIREVTADGAGVDTVYLTGGSSAIPLIRRMIGERSEGRVEAVVAAEPKAAVSLGALTGLPGTETAPGRPRLWRAEVTGRPGAPVLAGEVLYVGTDEGLIYALRAATGGQVWQTAVCAPVTSPAVHGDRLYVGDADGRLTAFAVVNGKRRWFHYLGRSVHRRPVTAAPVVDGGHVYVGTREQGLYKYTLDGGHVWTYGIAGVDGGAPVVAQGLVFAGSESGRVTAIDAHLAQRRMKRRLPGGAVSGSLAVTARHVFAADAGGTLHAVERAANNPVTWARDVGG
ncbi:PQQ-binding-like beta-propeller repeat protein, partial [Sphaerisporangium rubeum]|uniref:Hsp70 family protein n=1 Tax=Sphaerisporangium rubeum TaxID=321317 RepID=UPI0031D2AACF